MTDTPLEHLAQRVRQLEFQLEKADYGMGMPRDYRRVLELRTAVEDARKAYNKALEHILACERAARAQGWTQGGDCGGIIYNREHYESWKAAVSWSPADGPVYDTWQECCESEGIEL